jgi:ADP-dependent NAD(P)H-hydrate dehydratase / NAD(P)H-hydrate epimerase
MRDALLKVLAGREMQKLDEQAIEAGIPQLVLMENAARGAADVLVAVNGGVPARSWVVCGKGNNGGDGLATARHLHNRGSSVEVLLLGQPEQLSGAAAVCFSMLRATGLEPHAAADAGAASAWLSREPPPDVLVDAILGTGIDSAPRGLPAAAIEAIRRRPELPVFALDLPSGLSADSGAVPGVAIRAKWTATFAAPKVPHFVYPAAGACGRVEVVEISIPRGLLDAAPAVYWTGPPPLDWMPVREPEGHKGTYGRLLILAGSVGMTGAACLAAQAAVRGGAGLVTVACPASVSSIVATKTTESLTLPLPVAPDGGLAPESAGIVLSRLSQAGTSLLLGPGLGTADSTLQVVNRLLERVDTRLVLDADGLNCLAKGGDVSARLAARRAITLLTPHPGEMARLLGRHVGDRLADTRELAAASRSVVLLKGAGTVVSDGMHTFVSRTGNPGLATGGTGDVLSGLLGALLAQGLPAFRAAALGAFLHGLAGDLAAAELGLEALAAGDLADFLPDAWQRWRQVAAARGPHLH